MVIDHEADPDQFRQPGNRRSRSDDDMPDLPMLALLDDGPKTHTEWKKLALSRHNIKASSFNNRLKELKEDNLVVQIGEGVGSRYQRVPRPAAGPVEHSTSGPA